MKHAARVQLGLKRSLVSWLARRNARHGVFGVELRSSVGLGAKLEWALEIMAYCDEHGLQPRFRFSSPDAREPVDYFGRLFSIKGALNDGAKFVTISSIIELDLGRDYDRLMTLELATYLIDKYLAVRQDVIDEVDEFCNRHFHGRSVLGVHYRGTDKVREAPPVSYDKVLRNIAHYLELYPGTDGIFIATDDENFLDHLQHARPARTIVFRQDSVRSRDGRSIHGSPEADTYAINRDAIVNCLLLSRCDALLKTASILSGWSKLFNPRLPVVMLNRPPGEHLWFPERALVGNALFQPVD